MKTNSIFLILFLACRLLYAQTTTGIAVQGIARNAEKAAIVDQTLHFTFTISGTPSGGSLTTYYKETADITTDAFGVFSHIIGSGTSVSGGTFANVPFGKAHMMLKVEANGITLLDGPLQYAPYAKNADNGVPVGGVIMWSGSISSIPSGWALCDGQTVDGISTPNLSGRFIVGYGNPDYTPNNASDYTTIGKKGGEEKHTLTENEMPSHKHAVSSENAGNHSHTISIWQYTSAGTGVNNSGIVEGVTFVGEATNRAWSNTTGSHSHTINMDNTGGGAAHENRPPYYVLAYIMRIR